MTPEEKAKDLIEDFSIEIGQSDFHVPKFISGVKCADGSDEYGKILDEETKLLAKQCALICVDEMQKVENEILQGVPTDYVYGYEPDLEEVKIEINKN